MISNFLNLSGWFAGMDCHTFWELLPPPTGFPFPMWPHIAGHSHIAITHRPWRWVTTVTTNGEMVLQKGWAMQLVPHMFMPNAPHAAEALNLLSIFAFSNSTPTLNVHSVSGQGEPLLAEAVECAGVNTDCGFPSIGADVNFNSVITSPSAGDYAAAAYGAALSTATGVLVGAAPGGDVLGNFLAVGDVLSDLSGENKISEGEWAFAPIGKPISELSSKVQKAVDGEGT